jgi:hypothetical protein
MLRKFRRAYPKDERGNTVFPRKLRRIEWYRGPWIYRYAAGGFEGYRHLFTGRRTVGATLAAWKWIRESRARQA